MGRWSEAEALYMKTIALSAQLYGEVHHTNAMAHFSLAYMLISLDGWLRDAEEHYQKSCTLFQQLSQAANTHKTQ